MQSRLSSLGDFRRRRGERGRRRKKHGKGCLSLSREEEWVRVERTQAFKELIRQKKAFIIPATIFFVIFYFGLPVLTGFTTLLDVQVVGSISLAYLYAFAQFAMTWILMHLYLSRANRWDELVERARRQAAEGEVS
jgi:uncharacterized membrane protein (DUF485 family)